VQPQTFPFQNIPYVTSSEKAEGLSFQLWLIWRKGGILQKILFRFSRLF